MVSEIYRRNTVILSLYFYLDQPLLITLIPSFSSAPPFLSHTYSFDPRAAPGELGVEKFDRCIIDIWNIHQICAGSRCIESIFKNESPPFSFVLHKWKKDMTYSEINVFMHFSEFYSHFNEID